MAKGSTVYTLLEFIGNPITAMFIAVFVAYYILGLRQQYRYGYVADPHRKRFWLHR